MEKYITLFTYNNKYYVKHIFALKGMCIAENLVEI